MPMLSRRGMGKMSPRCVELGLPVGPMRIEASIRLGIFRTRFAGPVPAAVVRRVHAGNRSM